ncbi:Gfo/Idh/MocA family protein [Thermotoga caldifontis]|uniref:Gfo/Idh/MocA family protein n=1 Tax=Thermotoga caldifontis TaxID=1508419 RepID=UPI00059768F5|nr:Gfo/Idh/MocA family oxidoreductase [Thermotoga caldifontis]
MEPIRVALVGAGGYGKKYAEHLLAYGKGHGTELIAVIDPFVQKSEIYQELVSQKIAIFDDLAQFYSDSFADLVVISTPIHLHCEQTCEALQHGSHVLCEKPAAATVHEIRKMIEFRDEFRRVVAIGFQWCHDETVQKLKEDVLSGKFGRAVKFKSLVLWPRDTAYYRRSSWAGKIKLDGKWVLDSVASNATAHFLHFMMFLLGSNMLESAFPEAVQAELYRANEIESFDTCAMRIEAKGTEILFFASHAVKNRIGPIFELQFEKARLVFNHPRFPESANRFVLVRGTGLYEPYGAVDHSSMKKLWDVVSILKGEERIYCTLESALSLTATINCAHLSSAIRDFPQNLKKSEGEPVLIWVDGLEERLKECFDSEKLPSELGFSWATEAKRVTQVECEVFELET